MYQTTQESIQPPQGFVPRFTANLPYSGGGPNPYFMDSVTKKLFFSKLKKSKPKENRVNFIQRNRDRIQQLQTLINQQQTQAIKPKKLIGIPPQPLQKIIQEYSDKDVDELIQFANNLDEQEQQMIPQQENNEDLEVDNTGIDQFQQDLIDELRIERDKTDEKIDQVKQIQNEYVEKQKVFTLEQKQSQASTQNQQTLAPSNQNHMFNILEFTNSMTKTRQVLQDQEEIDLDDIEDIPKKILQTVKNRQLQFKKDSPFLQPYLFRGRF